MMEAAMREVLVEGVSRPVESNGLFLTLLDRFSALGGVDLDLPEWTTAARLWLAADRLAEPNS
jgi:hypothetical protein